MTKICINDKTTFNVELGHTLEEWSNQFSNNENLWDFPIEEMIDGTIEPNEDMVYWLIDGRLCETDMSAL